MKSYTYHLYHKPSGLHYYGASYRKGCSPNDLWDTYFSSSPIVHELIAQHGKDSFVATVRKTFDSPGGAVLWESRFLQKVNAQHSDTWINRHNGCDNFIGPHSHTEQSKQQIRSKITGTKRSEETKAKMRKAALRREHQRRESSWQYPKDARRRAVKTRNERIAAGDINPYSEDRNKKMAASKRGTKRHYLPDGSFVMVRPQADQ